MFECPNTYEPNCIGAFRKKDFPEDIYESGVDVNAVYKWEIGKYRDSDLTWMWHYFRHIMVWKVTGNGFCVGHLKT